MKEHDKVCPLCLFVATPLFNLNIKGAKVWSTGAQDGEGTAEEEQDMGGDRHGDEKNAKRRKYARYM